MVTVHTSPAGGATSYHVSSPYSRGIPHFRFTARDFNTPHEKWDAVGNGVYYGLFARSAGALSTWTRLGCATPTSASETQLPIVRSYCFTRDEFCQSEFPAGGAVHSSYQSSAAISDAWYFMRGFIFDNN